MSDSPEWRQYMDKMFARRSSYRSNVGVFGIIAGLFMLSVFQGLGSSPEPWLVLIWIGGGAISLLSLGIAAFYFGRLVELEQRILDSGDVLAKRQLLAERVTDSKQNSRYWLLVAAVFVLGGVALLWASIGATTPMVNGMLFLFVCAIAAIIGWYMEMIKRIKTEKEFSAA